MGQLVIYCRIKQNTVGSWFIQSVYAGHLAWTGGQWVPHVDGAGIRYRISNWESELDAKEQAKIQGFVVID
jgi:hypothetical protein